MNKVITSDMVVFIVTLVFLAGGGWMSLGNVEDRVEKLEVKQDETAKDIRQIMTTQAAICVATEANCG
tara:strand:+ start:900 stop:1103 length:204 start_codon:yes stop_codon:yes gene_type:complete